MIGDLAAKERGAALEPQVRSNTHFGMLQSSHRPSPEAAERSPLVPHRSALATSPSVANPVAKSVVKSTKWPVRLALTCWND